VNLLDAALDSAVPPEAVSDQRYSAGGQATVNM